MTHDKVPHVNRSRRAVFFVSLALIVVGAAIWLLANNVNDASSLLYTSGVVLIVFGAAWSIYSLLSSDQEGKRRDRID